MKRHICFSTGSFFVKGKKRDLNKHIAKCKALDIDGVEILIGDVDELMGFKLSESNRRFLKKLKFNTIHAPFHDDGNPFYYKNNKKTIDVLKKLVSIAKQIDAKAINIHTHEVNNFSVLDKFDFQFCIENSTIKHKVPVRRYTELLKKYPELRFVIDTTHAIDKKDQLESLVKSIQRPMYIHLSANVEGLHHVPMHVAKKKYQNLIRPVLDLDIPVIIETWTEIQDIKFHKKEVNFVRKWLSF